MIYQRKKLATGENVGEPGPLPADLVGLADESLADLSAALTPKAAAQLGYVGAGFFPVPTYAEPEPLRIGKYWLFERFTEEQERRVAILEAKFAALSPARLADLADQEAQGLFQFSRFLRRLNALGVVELNAPATLAGFELLRLLGVFGDPATQASRDELARLLAPPFGREWDAVA